VTVNVKNDLRIGSIECTANGRSCRYDPQTEELLNDYVGSDSDAAAAEAEYFGLLVRHALCLQPAILVNGALLDEWRRHLPAGLSREDAATLLAGLLDARLRVDNPTAITTLISAEKTIAELLEDCLAAFSATHVTVRVARMYYDAICTDPAADLTQTFDSMRRELFGELGVPCPYISVEPDDELRDRGFAVVINGLTGTPRAGIPPDRMHVNDTPERLKLMNVEASNWRAPDVRYAGAVIARDHEELLTAAGLNVLLPLPYIVAAVREEVRRHAALLVNQEALAMLLAALRASFPVLTEAALSAVPLWQLTSALRELASDRVPLRSLPVILERVVDFPFSEHAENRYSVDEGRIVPEVEGSHADRLVSFLRAGLAREIAWVTSRQTTTVMVYLLDERDLSPLHDSEGTQFEEAIDEFIRALENEIAFLPPTAQAPSLLASTKTARLVRPVLRVRFPWMAVLSYADLPPDVNVQPVARITF
jgi:type III secretory pathway component EscV